MRGTPMKLAKKMTRGGNPNEDGPTQSTAPQPKLEQQKNSEFHKLMNNPDIVERVRCTIQNAHVFKLPARQSAGGWRGADWRDKVWQGTVKVVERGNETAVLLVDRTTENIFAVCPVREGSVDRCVDSSRYFVLRLEGDNGRHMFIGMAFNERNDAFDFNTSLEDSRREREAELNPVKAYTGPAKDYSLKEGEKIRVSIPKINGNVSEGRSAASTARTKRGNGKQANGLALAPSSRDTPSRSRARNTDGPTTFGTAFPK